MKKEEKYGNPKDIRKELDKLSEFIGEIDEKLQYMPDLDGNLSDYLEYAKAELQEPKKRLGKKQKLEQAVKFLTENYPNLLKSLNRIDELGDALSTVIKDKQDKLDELQGLFEDLDTLQQEIEEKYRDL